MPVPTSILTKPPGRCLTVTVWVVVVVSSEAVTVTVTVTVSSVVAIWWPPALSSASPGVISTVAPASLASAVTVTDSVEGST